VTATDRDTVERDLEREPGLGLEPPARQLAFPGVRELERLLGRPAGHPDDCSCGLCKMRTHRSRALGFGGRLL
jgi:hypothetical protein